MTTATLAFIAVALTYVASRTSYSFIRFFAGAFWWALGVWLLNSPLVAGSSPINDIMVVLCFFGGFAVMFWMGWRTDTVNGREIGRFNIRLPSFLGGSSEEEEQVANNARNWRNRRANYEDRLRGAIRGRR